VVIVLSFTHKPHPTLKASGGAPVASVPDAETQSKATPGLGVHL